MREDSQLLEKRLLELAGQCYQRDIPTFSLFLNLNEQTVFHSLYQNLPPVHFRLEGGYADAERKIVCFLPVMGNYSGTLPIRAVHVRPRSPKFAQVCTHRDYLGAVLNLGIDRSQVGDILISGQEAHILCLEKMGSFIADQLVQVRHNPVVCQCQELSGFSYTPNYREVTGSIASLRLDSMVSLGFGLSRSKAVECIKEGRVFVNGKLIDSSSFEPKEGDLVSVRKLGKFRYKGFVSKTKKGRDYVVLQVFV